MSSLNNTVSLPANVENRLKSIQDDFEEGDITLKGYCKQRFALLQSYLDPETVSVVAGIQNEVLSKNISENVAYLKIQNLLRLENIKPVHVLRSTENLPVDVIEDINLAGPSSSKASTPCLKTQKITKFFPRNDKKLSTTTNSNYSAFKNQDGVLIHKNSDENSALNCQITCLNKENSAPNNQTSVKCSGTSCDTNNYKKNTALHHLSNKISNHNAKTHKNTFETGTNLESVSDSLTNTTNTHASVINTLTNHKTISESVKERDVLVDTSNKRKNSDGDLVQVKKIKLERDASCVRASASVVRTKIRLDRCSICRQVLNSDVLYYNGHPNGAVDEFIALTDPKLMLFNGNESKVNKHDEMPHNKITHFSVYDKQGHLCPIDTGLIEDNVLLYFSGYLKPIYEESSAAEGGIAAKDLGPINEWWVSGFDGGERALLGFSTAYGQYYLMTPSAEYLPLMKSLTEKVYLSKIVIEFLLSQPNPSYEDLLDHVCSYVCLDNVQFSEEKLLRHAQFVCDQVNSFDLAAESEDDRLLITTACMRTLVKLAGVNFARRRALRKQDGGTGTRKKSSKIVWTRATTTDLVRKVFESFFPEQLDKNEQVVRRTRCGVCATCQLPDCGSCSSCRDKIKYGGKGRCKQACIRRRCPNLAIQDADDSETEDVYEDPRALSQKSYSTAKQVLHPVHWSSSAAAHQGGRRYYRAARVGTMHVQLGDYVMLQPTSPSQPLLIAQVVYMFEEQPAGKMFHAQLLWRGCDTILGEVADPRELYVVDQCDTCPLGAIVRKTAVSLKDTTAETVEFVVQKKYDRALGRFEDLDPDNADDKSGYTVCEACRRRCRQRMAETPRLVDGAICWRGQEYRVGCGVYLVPGTFVFRSAPAVSTARQRDDAVDEEIYPEYYRKKSDTPASSSADCFEPFCIGYVNGIHSRSAESLQVQVQKLYRPENTHRGAQLGHQLDLNLVYWSEEEVTVPFGKVAGRCHLVYADILDGAAADWSRGGPDRFYFRQTYCADRREFLPVGGSGGRVGMRSKGGRVKGRGPAVGTGGGGGEEQWPALDRPLRTMDVFAGCGGLSEGLHQSGVAETLWAIEKEDAAARAFQLNNPHTTVYPDDCNALLGRVMAGATHTGHLPLPPRHGAVELLVGGPPCQGFSGMNRFSAGQYSLFKNSLIVSYLSYCDYYRPRYFVLENVRTFSTFKKSTVLKLTLRCLLAMGYQCTFGVLQAGHYGVPQSRRRLFILAAAPGEVLPRYPEPMHVFHRRAAQLNVVVDGCRYSTGSRWLSVGAPYRTITVRDAMSDLPALQNGATVQELPYDSEPQSHFQRRMRSGNAPQLYDHVCKEMAPIVAARIAHIPTAPGSDWRDLPNIEVALSDGTRTSRLLYLHRDRKHGNAPNGMLRGVCACNTGTQRPCDAQARQYNTLIPWCLPHTGNRHNQWAGLYGRLEWAGVFSTTVTNPEPMGKQGRVLHPEQTRVVSVRECARSQGFRDGYRFCGGVLDKYRQIGNAVPPPLGRAVGREIVRAILAGVRQRNRGGLVENAAQWGAVDGGEDGGRVDTAPVPPPGAVAALVDTQIPQQSNGIVSGHRDMLECNLENVECLRESEDSVKQQETVGHQKNVQQNCEDSQGNGKQSRAVSDKNVQQRSAQCQQNITQGSVENQENVQQSFGENQKNVQQNCEDSQGNVKQSRAVSLENVQQRSAQCQRNIRQSSVENQRNVKQSQENVQQSQENLQQSQRNVEQSQGNVQQSSGENQENVQQRCEDRQENGKQSSGEVTDTGTNTQVTCTNTFEEYFDKLMAVQHSLTYNDSSNDLVDVEE